MDFDRLCEITTKATGTVLRHHSGQNIVHDGFLPVMIRKEIHEVYRLRDIAQDTSVADLEIACDAAVSIAEAYNRAPQEPSFQDTTTLRRLRPERSGVPSQPKINLRWFYICVQGLLLVDIKPELLLDGRVDRLPRNTQQQQPPPSQSDSVQSASFSPADSTTLAADSSPSPASSPEPSAPSSSSSGNAERVSPKLPKAKWEDDEIQLMVRLKASGMRHCDVAARLGRGLGSVENKYGRIMQQEEWKAYLAEVESSLHQKGKHRG